MFNDLLDEQYYSDKNVELPNFWAGRPILMIEESLERVRHVDADLIHIQDVRACVDPSSEPFRSKKWKYASFDDFFDFRAP